MLIVGVGCAPDLITMQAAEIIWNAKRVAGSEQALTLAEEYIQETSFVYVLKDYFKLEEFPSDTVILTTGDPMLAGLHAEGADYVPGISSMQVALPGCMFRCILSAWSSPTGRTIRPVRSMMRSRRSGAVATCSSPPTRNST